MIRRPSGLGSMVARGLLAAISLVALLPVSLAILGGYLPRVYPFGPFGAVINGGLPWLVFALLIGTGTAAATVVLGGRKARILLAANVAVLAAAGYIGYRYLALAAEHGVAYDVGRAANGYPPLVDTEAKLVFATVDGVGLRAGVWLPSGADAGTPASLPAAVFVHGGSFRGGGLWTRPTLLDALRKAGIVAIDIEYRLAPPPRWNQAPGDVLCALAWLRSTADLPVVDRNRVAIIGESAGGNLAMVAGYAAGTNAITSSCPASGAPIVPIGVVAIAPTADIEGIWHDQTLYDAPGVLFPEFYIGGPPAQYPDRYAAASPFSLLRPTLPPTLMLVAENDQYVHIERQRVAYERIKASGASIEMISVPFTVHGFDGEPNSFGAQFVEHVVPDFIHTLAR